MNVTPQQQQREDQAEAAFKAEVRLKDKYGYRRSYENDFGCYVLDVKASTFGTIWIPENQQPFFKKIFSTEGEGKKLQPLHHARPNDICASITVTKTSVPPLKLEPLTYPPNTNKIVQYLLLDEQGFEKFLSQLPYFVEKVIPWVEAQSVGVARVKNLSPYSTLTSTRQIKGNCTLRHYPAQDVQLDMGVVPFEAGPSLELRYTTTGSRQARSGAYFNKALIGFLMDERPAMEDILSDLREAGPWANIVPDFVGDEAEGAVRKRELEQDSQDATQQHKRMRADQVEQDTQDLV